MIHRSGCGCSDHVAATPAWSTVCDAHPPNHIWLPSRTSTTGCATRSPCSLASTRSWRQASSGSVPITTCPPTARRGSRSQTTKPCLSGRWWPPISSRSWKAAARSAPEAIWIGTKRRRRSRSEPGRGAKARASRATTSSGPIPCPRARASLLQSGPSWRPAPTPWLPTRSRPRRRTWICRLQKRKSRSRRNWTSPNGPWKRSTRLTKLSGVKQLVA